MQKIHLALFYLFLHIPFLNAQNSITDYKQSLSIAKHDSVRLQLSSQLAWLYTRQMNDSAFYYFNQALTLAEKNQDYDQTAKILLDIGVAYAQSFHNETEGIKWLKKSLAEAKKRENYKIAGRSYVYLGIILDHQNMNDDAEQLLQKGISNVDKSNDPEAKAIAYHIMGDFLRHKRHDLEKAEQYELKALNLAEQLRPIDWIMYCNNYCESLLKNGKKAKAQAYYEKAAALIIEKNIECSNASNAMFIVFLHGAFQKYDLMEAAFEHLLYVVQPNETEVLADAYNSIAEFRNKQGNYKGAYEALLQARIFSDSINLIRLSENTRVQATKLKSTLDLAQKEQELATQRWILAGGAAILALALGFIYYFYRSRQQITRQKTELEDLNKTKDRLLSIIAHDLRSPIGWLKDSFDLMDSKEQAPEKMTRFLAKSKERVEQVYNTMENLLVWALAQRNGLKPRFETVSIAEAVAEQMDNTRDFAQRKGITIQNDTPQYLTAWVDKNQLAIVLNNLLQNALKFTPSGGTVVLSVEQTSDKLLTIKIADSGVGMDIVEWQLQQKTQTILSKEGTAKEKGTGLGLFLVKEIVDKNGGTLAIQSEKGVGTTVSVGLKKGNGV
jgi:signal transduction histidine kinase